MSDCDDDEVAFLYRQSVMGKEVWIKFRVASSSTGFEYFKGIITKMEASFPDQDTSNPIEYMHYIYFGDSDDGYYDLSDMEMTGYLKWSAEAAKNDVDNNDNNKKRAASNTAAPPAARHVPVTPEKRTPQQRSRNNNNGASNIVKVKREPGGIVGSVRSNIQDPTNHEINMKEFEQWVRNIHKGSKGLPISQANARSVLNRVRDLVSGRGITYKNWPHGMLFHPEIVTLQTDLKGLLKQAKDFERKHGRDKGNGWLLQHPIKKLDLYKEYIEEKRNERENPINIS